MGYDQGSGIDRRAVLQSIREPTPEMVDAASQSPIVSRAAAAAAWTAMVDHLLKIAPAGNAIVILPNDPIVIELCDELDRIMRNGYAHYEHPCREAMAKAMMRAAAMRWPATRVETAGATP
jgi:hypothetical protein